MTPRINLAGAVILCAASIFAQPGFDYELRLTPVIISNLPGLHSYAYAQHEGKWLIVGGRRDGIHARQPFASFAQASNNTQLYVIDVQQRAFWSASVHDLPAGLRDQLQSTNMQFYQDGSTLYLIGGYGLAPGLNVHATHPRLTAVDVPGLMGAIQAGTPISSYFKQITHEAFAVTGGQLGKIGQTFYLIGGHRFDGRYNPMGPDHGPGFSQAYTNQIRKFTININGDQLSFGNYEVITDPIHLRRRDYNLLPQIFPDGSRGYTIFSGVFQLQADLPFLYPVDVTESGYNPVTHFNQYLCNYHSAKAALYDSTQNRMYAIFFGGISQYYYQNGQLVQDNLVPFVRTISLVARAADGSLQEYQLPVEMSGLKGAGAEFIPNHSLPHYENEVIKLSEIHTDTLLIGHIYGGILSHSLHPFETNQTSTTSADPTIYAVQLIRKQLTGAQMVANKNPFDFEVFPNPAQENIRVIYDLPYVGKVHYFLATMDGKILQRGVWSQPTAGRQEQSLYLHSSFASQQLTLTLALDNKYYAVKKLLVRQ